MNELVGHKNKNMQYFHVCLITTLTLKFSEVAINS